MVEAVSRRAGGIAAVCMLLATFMLGLGSEGAEAAPLTLTVSKTADTNDGTCDADCSFREALLAAGANTGETDVIKFDPGTFSPATIIPTSALPGIGEAVIIDGLDGAGDCDGGSAQVNLDGSSGFEGISLIGGADGTVICGIATHSFAGNGITVGTGADDVTLSEVYSGTDVTGSATGLGNGGAGIFVGSDGVAIEDAVLLDNGSYGLNVDGAGPTVTVTGSLIGLAADGTAAGNDLFGIRLGSGVSGSQIGGTAAGEGNVISANKFDGVVLAGESVTIEGNLIGTDATGTVARPNERGGINVSGSQNTIGGTAAGAENVLSGNQGLGAGDAAVSLFGSSAENNVVEGNLIGTDVTGTTAIGNQIAGVEIASGATGNTIGGTAAGAGNTIGGTGGSGAGVLISGVATTGNAVEGNLIGTDVTGSVGLGNSTGIEIETAELNTIGGTVPAAANVISGNGIGVAIAGDSNTVQRNLIGLDKSGTSDLGNSNQGVLIDGGSENEVGTVGHGNVISGGNNEAVGAGVTIAGPAATGNTVRDNLIGTDPTGTGAISNEGGGVSIEAGADSNRIGGPLAGQGNVISGNDDFGLQISGSGTSENSAEGNLIGLSLDGASDLGNIGPGVRIDAAPGTTIGSADSSVDAATPGARNVISGNAVGLEVANAAQGREIKGNFIGTSLDGSDGTVGNDGDGIRLFNSGSDPDEVAIGGPLAGEANRIFFNGDAGVSIEDGIENPVLRNAIGSNDDLGIDLGDDGVTANDPGDGDGGPNKLQNFPDLTKAEANPAETRIEGMLSSQPSKTYQVEFFTSSSCDASVHGEGESYLGAFPLTTGPDGNAPFSTGVGPGTVGDWLTATATDPDGNTSEFGFCEQIAPDTTAPETTIGEGPAAGSTIADRTPTFGFGSTEVATFECEVDNMGFSPCTTPATLGPLPDGQHTFKVRATDSAANTDLSPDTRSFRVDTTAPQTTIDSGLADGALTNDPTPEFGFSSSEPGSSFACRVGPAPFSACPGPGGGVATLGPLADGDYNFAVRATDPTGNADATPATRSFTVDTVISGAKLKGKRKQRQRGRKIRVKLKLKAGEDAEARAKGRVTIKGAGKKAVPAAKSIKLKPVDRSLQAGKTTAATLKVSGSKKKRKRLERRIAKALKKGKKVQAKASASFSDAAGNAERLTRDVRLR